MGDEQACSRWARKRRQGSVCLQVGKNMSVSSSVTHGCAPGSLGAHSKGRGGPEARVVQGRPGGGGSGPGVRRAGVSPVRVGGGCGLARPGGSLCPLLCSSQTAPSLAGPVPSSPSAPVPQLFGILTGQRCRPLPAGQAGLHSRALCCRLWQQTEPRAGTRGARRGEGAGQGPARSLRLRLHSQAEGWLNPLWSLDPGASGMAVGGVKGDVLGIPEPQHLLFCPLQLLEMSFNCLEDVESTIPVSPLHLAVSPRSFPLAFPVPSRPRPAHRYQHV